MITVTQAQEEIARRVLLLAAESVPLSQAHGRILREPIASPGDLPPFDRSAMDGYAIRADDSADELEVVGEIRAGQVIDRELKPGQAMRIFTGARLPAANLRIVMQEHVEVRGQGIRIRQRLEASHVRLRGEDAREGEVLLPPATVLEAAALGLLASLGKTSVQVSCRPRVIHLTTGDEIIPPEQVPGPGQVRNSNAALITALCREAGGAEVLHRHAGDNLPAMKLALDEMDPSTADLILISGGSGPGDYDFTAELFRHLQADIYFREINVRPGKPLIFGTKGTRMVFGLPGNALSHFVCFHLFVRRAIDGLMGSAPRPVISGLLSETLSGAFNSRETWWPARATQRAGRLECRALPWKSSGDITRLPAANALIHVPSSTPTIPAGTMVQLLPVGTIV